MNIESKHSTDLDKVLLNPHEMQVVEAEEYVYMNNALIKTICNSFLNATVNIHHIII